MVIHPADEKHRVDRGPQLTHRDPRLVPVMVGVFLLSLSVLVYEITLTRLFSVTLTYHYVFLVLSIALFGLAFGGVFEDRLHARRLARKRPESSLSRWSAVAALTMAISTVLMIPIGETSSPLLLSSVAVIPFFFTGVVLAAAFRRFAAHSSRLYAFDLAGAAVGALAVVWALNTFGGINAALFSALVAGLSSLLLLFERPLRTRSAWLPASTTLAIAALFIFNSINSVLGEIPIGNSPDKELSVLLREPSLEAEIIETRWSAFGRTDLVGGPKGPDVMGLYIDGAAGTSMYRWNGSREDTTGALGTLKYGFAGSFPLAFLDESQKDNALIIGPGGGRDVLASLLWGVREITAVEVNPDFVALVRKYEDFNGGIYTRMPNVNVIVEEGRNYLKRSKQLYDLIMLTLPITKSSRSFQGYALTENFLFTKESFQDYLAHLTPEGSLVIVAHSLPESLRLLTTGLAALEEMGVGVTEAMKRIYVLGEHRMPVVVFQKTAMEESRADALHALMHLVGFDGRVSYIPYAKQQVIRVMDAETDSVEAEWQMMNQTLIDLAEGNLSLDELVHAFPFDLRPTNDDRPFFFNYRRGLPTVLVRLFWMSLVFLLAVLFAPAALRRRRQRRHRDLIGRARRRVSLPGSLRLLFLGIGVGFMLVEVALFQKLLLFLGQPTVALALLLFALLMGTGLGSLTSRRVRSANIVRAITISAAAAAGVVLLSILLLRPLSESLLVLGALRFAGAAIVVILIGFPMGFPFPLGIRLLKERGHESEIPWMWAVNGSASVFGAVLAVASAVLWGYSASLWLGGLSYLCVAVAVSRSRALKWKEVEAAAPAAVPVEC